MISRNWMPLVLAALLMSNAQAQERFSIKEDSPSVGSNIRREVATSAVPFDKRYDELTPEQRQLLRAQYEGLPGECEPPFPERGLMDIYRHVVKIQRNQSLRGELLVTAMIDAEGKAQTVKIYRTPDPKLGAAIAEILVGTPFRPARCAGKAVAMEFPIALSLSVALR